MESCCAKVCACDPFCCDVVWDEACATDGQDSSGCGAAVLCGECIDGDGDGVEDAFDDCCNTPAGVAVDAAGRPIGDFDLDCDTDLIDYVLFQQGFTGAMGPGADRVCNPVAQTGCDPCEKCALVRDAQNPDRWRAYCRTDGSVPRGGACTADETTGLDDCEAGLTCANAACAEICTVAPNSCPTGEQCNVIAGIADLPDVGYCEPNCDPLQSPHDCPDGEACYVVVSQGTAMCMYIAGEDTQGVACEYLNICAAGYGCVLISAPPDPPGLDCAFICDALASGGPTCADGPGATYTCVPINRFYSDTGDVPDAYGMCVDPVEWDEDGDSVLDYEDECPGTPSGTPVNDVGCPL